MASSTTADGLHLTFTFCSIQIGASSLSGKLDSAFLYSLHLLGYSNPVPWNDVRDETIHRIANDLIYPDKDLQDDMSMSLSDLGARAVSHLIDLLKQSDVTDYIPVARTLSNIGEPALDPLVEILDVSSQNIFVRVAPSLVWMGGATYPRLRQLLRSSNPELRQ